MAPAAGAAGAGSDVVLPTRLTAEGLDLRKDRWRRGWPQASRACFR